MDLIPVASAFDETFEPIRADAPLSEVLRIMGEGTGTHFPVLDGDGRLLGTGVAARRARRAARPRRRGDPHRRRPLRRARADGHARDEPRSGARPDGRGRARGASRRGERRPEARARSALARRRDPRLQPRARHDADDPRRRRRRRDAAMVEGLSRGAAARVPAAWDGRTLRDLDCRARFGVSVLAVEPRDKPGHTFEVPTPIAASTPATRS